MANCMIHLIQKVQLNGPCAVVGYSSGGILAYEITKQLINSGQPVSFLGLIDTYSPEKLNKTEIFAEAYKQTDDTLNKLVSESIEKEKKENVELKIADVAWETLIQKQQTHYQNICQLYKIDLLPIRVHLFMASEFSYLHKNGNDGSNDVAQKNIEKNIKRSYKLLGWENYDFEIDFHVIPVNGDHLNITFQV